MNTKVRLVRCPKCRKVLPELSDVPVYKCKGCGAVLQAKIPKNVTKDGASQVSESDPTTKCEVEFGSVDAATTSVNNQQKGNTEEGGDRDVSTDFVGEHLNNINSNYSDGARSSTDISSHETAESSPDIRVHMESVKEHCPLDQNRRDQEASLPDYHRKVLFPEQIDVNERSCSTGREHDRDHDELRYSSRIFSPSVDSLEGQTSSVVFHRHDTKGSLPVAHSEGDLNKNLEGSLPVAHSEGDLNKNLESSLSFRSMIAEKLLDTRNRKFDITSPRHVNEVAQSENLMSSNNEPMNRNLFCNLQQFGRMNSLDTSEDTSFRNRNSNFIATLGDIPKSRSYGSYYAYEASVSSFDENDDQVPDLQYHGSRRDFVERCTGVLKRSDLGVNRSKLDQESVQTTRQDHHARSVMDLISSGLGPSEFQHSWKYHSAKRDNSESEKLKLLRMVHELQDQLNRANISKEKAYGRFAPEVSRNKKHTLSYCDHLAAERGMYRDSKCSRYPEGNFPPRTVFSEESVFSRGKCSCFHCCLQGQHSLAQIPPHLVGSNKGCYDTHGFYSPFHSSSSSPKHRSDSEAFLRNHETVSEAQKRRKDRESKMKHFRPIAGGAPWVTCYQCSKVLQLPADFLLFKSRCHSLKCSACSNVLKFSLRNNTHLVRYDPEVIAPPCSEAGDYSDTGKENVLGYAEAVSYSDDYGQSFSKSYSMETDCFSIKNPFRSLYRNSRSRKTSSGSNREALEGRISEIEEGSPKSGSPLHRLMGYASPSKVLRG